MQLFHKVVVDLLTPASSFASFHVLGMDNKDVYGQKKKRGGEKGKNKN